MEELRAYFFQNMYLQGIHAGIQSQHTTVEMFLKYPVIEDWEPREHDLYEVANELLYEWADDYKTTIVLNGGYAANLTRLIELFSSENNPYPWAYFEESAEALEGCITNVGIILPEKVFNLRPELGFEGTREKYTTEEIEEIFSIEYYDFKLAEEVSRCRLMN